MANSTSSSFAYEWSYDVFLNFRGEDTRYGFTGHLFHALCQKGVKTFMDDQDLRKGEGISALMEAIQESRTAIVIFSKDYASSQSCLEELVMIMECLNHKGRLVWPVFYKVDPCDVRHQKESYAEALAKQETRISDKDKVNKWRSVLQAAANLYGWHFGERYEYEFIGEIVQEVSKWINRSTLHVAHHPVGLESRVQKVKSLLDVESNDGVNMVGIYGIGGIGKTTLACDVYNFIAHQFEGHSIIADIRENSMKKDLVQLQETLLCDVVGEKDIKLGNVKKGIPIIKSRLCKKKVLLILDDVDKLEQLEALAGGPDWFGPGSRIIITTRDMHLLHFHDVKRTYKVEGLNDVEALELFSRDAFKRKHVDPDYLEISKRVLQHSNGLPLALKIIGSDLYGKTDLEWKSALDTYERIPHDDIQQILRVSYDGLKEFEKEIFLDIACFFKGYTLSYVKDMLHSGRSSAPDNAIRVLIDKCLIEIDKLCDKLCVRMHDLIEDMGREIVRLESPSEPGERSRLWSSEDILHVFEQNKGSNKTEIIMLRLSKDEEVQWNPSALEKMENLKVLVVENAHFFGDLVLPQKSLRVLKWYGYPESSLPADFDPKKLVILDLPMSSSFTFNNQLNMKFKSLTEMNLSGCELLKEIPNMSEAPNLKKLLLDNCKNLVEVHDSVGFLGKLEYLIMDHCTNLKLLPREMNLTSLKNMGLWNCQSLMSFPEILGKMENVSELDLSGSAISGLHFSIGNLVGLTFVALNGCQRLLELPRSIFMLPKLWTFEADNCERLAQVQNEEGQDQETMSSHVKKASFHRCYHLTDKFLSTLLPCLRIVTDLSLNYSNITILPSCISVCLSLTKLSLNECKELREIRGLPPNIMYLSAMNCTSLTSESKEMLLNQTLHENGGKHFIFTGSAIPSWLNCSSKGPSLRFWFRNKFPEITLCAAGLFRSFDHRVWHLMVNDILQFSVYCCVIDHSFQVETNHTFVYDPLEIRVITNEELHIKNGWNSAEILFDYHEWMGVHVPEQKSNMADIQFSNPYSSMSK
ncbi:TMV resistance protein N-like isoform X2 [Cajanus cajan]|uniref:TMV resistance protein N-like isoform X2 n=1 Tax=Cajanus cajan TaxID=3821 RepID=UPI0010FB2233|nr:TMV resistance protein N-like isoform X2 [Cajanus cajan]